MANWVLHNSISVINVIVDDTPPAINGLESFEATEENINANRNLVGMDLYFPPTPEP